MRAAGTIYLVSVPHEIKKEAPPRRYCLYRLFCYCYKKNKVAPLPLDIINNPQNTLSKDPKLKQISLTQKHFSKKEDASPVLETMSPHSSNKTTVINITI